GLAASKAGRTCVSTAPLLEFTLGGRDIGDEIRLPPGPHRLAARVGLASNVPVDHLEIVGNGAVVATISLSGDRTRARDTVSIPVARSGWYVLRAYSDRAELPVLDLYPFAPTSPIYVQVGDQLVRSAADAASIPRSVFFGNAEKLNPQLSPDGQLLAYLAPDSGVLNVWVRTVGKRDDHPVTHDRTRPIYNYFWQGDSKHILHLQEHAGDENWRIYQTDLAAKTTRDLTPFDSVQTQILSVSPDFPDQILVAWNHRDR